MTRIAFLLSTCLPLIAALPVHAQDIGTDDTTIVVTASGVEQDAASSGRSITVLDRDTIETRQSVSLSDLLATTPGVGVTRNGGPGSITAVRIRGAEDAQTLVLIDGVRANDPSSPAGAFDFGNLLAGPVERVEVLRGPNSVIWGSQAMGGVVNIVTAPARAGMHARANAEYGYADQVVADAALSGGTDSVQGALTGGIFRTDGVSQAASGSEADGYRQYHAGGRVRAEFAPGIGIDLRGNWADSRVEIDGFPAPTYAFADTAEYAQTQELYGYAGVFARTGVLDSRASFSIADINRDNFDPDVQSDSLYLYRGRSERYEYRGDARIADMARIVFGAEHEDQRFFDGTATFDAGLTSFFGQAIVQPVDALTLTAGVRNDDHSDFGSHQSWGANAALTIGAGTLLHASFGEGFKAPTLYQLFAPYYGTQTLVPETSESFEAGIVHQLLNGAVRIGATWFHRDTRNQIDFDLTTYTYANIARARAEGLELEVVARPSNALALTANYTLTDTENRSAGFEGNVLARRPRDTANVAVDWTAPFGLRLGSTLRIVGDSFNDAGNATRIDGYSLVDVRAEMPVGDRFAVYGRVENVFDETYQTVAGYGTYSRAAYAGVRVKLD